MATSRSSIILYSQFFGENHKEAESIKCPKVANKPTSEIMDNSNEYEINYVWLVLFNNNNSRIISSKRYQPRNFFGIENDGLILINIDSKKVKHN